jgi:hypothetical protein
MAYMINEPRGRQDPRHVAHRAAMVFDERRRRARAAARRTRVLTAPPARSRTPEARTMHDQNAVPARRWDGAT